MDVVNLDSDSPPDNIRPFLGRRVEVGSDEWEDEIMSALNELITRVLWLERQSGVEYDRINRTYKRRKEDYDACRDWYPDEGQF